MAYDRYVTEFNDNENRTYGVMDAEAREELSDVKSALLNDVFLLGGSISNGKRTSEIGNWSNKAVGSVGEQTSTNTKRASTDDLVYIGDAKNIKISVTTDVTISWGMLFLFDETGTGKDVMTDGI